jgi:hypothetical protein
MVAVFTHNNNQNYTEELPPASAQEVKYATPHVKDCQINKC